MMRLTLLFTLLMVMSLPISANEKTVTLKGVVMESEYNETVPWCTISLVLNDSAQTPIRKFPSTDKGVFTTELPDSGNFCLIFESIGLETYTKCFAVDELVAQTKNKTIDLGTITLNTSTTQIDEVSVVASKPLVTMELDRLTYDTESDPETKVINALDMMRKVPLLTVDGDDKIKMKGSSNFIIHVNGRKSAMFGSNPENVLRSLPASSIKRIEVITDPGPKYEAEGLSGIINIVTYESLVGYQGSVNLGVDINGGYGAGGYFTTKVGKLGLQANANFRRWNKPESYGSTVRENFTSSSVSTTEQYSTSQYKGYFGGGSLEINYEFDTANLVTVSLGGNSYGNDNYSTKSNTLYDLQSSPYIEFNNVTNSSSASSSLYANVDYQHIFKPEQKLTISYQFAYTGNPSSSNSEIVSILNYYDRLEQNIGTAKSLSNAAQIDYTQSWNKRMHTYEGGVKYNFYSNDANSYYTLYDSVADTWIDNPDVYPYQLIQDQHILGAYSSYRFQYKWFSLRAGARLEHTSQNVATYDTTFASVYTNLVPSISFGFKVAKTQNINLSYTQRLSRPSIYYLNPYLDISDPLNYSQGNTNLDVEVAHSFNASYGFFTPKFNTSISAWSSIVNNSIEKVYSMYNDSIVYSTYENIGRNTSFGGSLYLAGTLGKIGRATLNTYASYTIYEAEKIVAEPVNLFNYGANANLQFYLPWKLNLNFFGGYFTSSPGLQFTSSTPYYYYGMSIRRSFLDNKLNISLNGNSLFEWRQEFSYSIETSEYKATETISQRMFYVGLNVNYTFGKMREQIRKVDRSIVNDGFKDGGSDKKSN
ncbi:MAG: TonB-dependent receptor [bacterium]